MASCLRRQILWPSGGEHLRKPGPSQAPEDAPPSCSSRSLTLNMSSDYGGENDVTQLHSGSRTGDSPTLSRAAWPAPPSYPPRPDDPNECDSAYGEDSLLQDDTKTLASYITEYRYEYGRRYHAFRDGAYWVCAGKETIPFDLAPGFCQKFLSEESRF